MKSCLQHEPNLQTHQDIDPIWSSIQPGWQGNFLLYYELPAPIVLKYLI